MYIGHGLIQVLPRPSGDEGGQFVDDGTKLLGRVIEGFAVILNVCYAQLTLTRPVVQHSKPTHLCGVLKTQQMLCTVTVCHQERNI